MTIRKEEKLVNKNGKFFLCCYETKDGIDGYRWYHNKLTFYDYIKYWYPILIFYCGHYNQIEITK